MSSKFRVRSSKFVLFTALALSAATLFGAEGKWTPQQMVQLDPSWLKQQGLEVDPKLLWDPARGEGLLSAAVQIGPGGSGCSGGFISSDGLIITNHHCIFSILQEHSTTQNDVIEKGHVSLSRSEELIGKSVRVQIPRKFTDVTDLIRAAVPKKATDVQREKAIDEKSKALVAECEKQPNTRCKLAVFEAGVQYVLTESLELPDVRVVWAPPRAVGEYGGEIDNWMWPRHTGDFALARAYVGPDGNPAAPSPNNVPYKPRFFYPISRDGVQPGDFVMVLGYPGVTYRALSSAEMNERGQLYFPKREDLLGTYIRILEEGTKDSAEGKILVADRVKTLGNRYKNAQGQIAGLARGAVLAKQKAADDAVLAWARERKEFAGAAKAYDELARVVAEERATYDHDFLLLNLFEGSRALYMAQLVAHGVREQAKPDAARETDYQQRVISKVAERLEREQKNFYAPADEELLVEWVRRALQLPADSRIAAVDARFPKDADVAKIREIVKSMYATTRVTEQSERMKMWSETEAQLRARKDPLLDFGLSVDEEMRTLKTKSDRWAGAISRLRPEWRRAVMAHAGKPIAPDANSTLRVSFAHVKGYAPRDGVIYTPQTTLRGAIEKNTNEDPFDLPKEIADAANAGKYGLWRDARLGDVAIDFLADADTTGGNSGSPVINGKGELVGVNFDRVWENVANDFGYNPDVARNVSADVRYMLWILDQVQNAEAVLKELGVR